MIDDESRATYIVEQAVKYLAEYMDMHDPFEDQEQNQLLRHLSQFASQLMATERSGNA